MCLRHRLQFGSRTRYESGPTRSITTPCSYRGASRKLQIQTGWLIDNSWYWLCLSWCSLCFACCRSTRSWTVGDNSSRRVRSRRHSSKELDGSAVVVCGVVRYYNKNIAKMCSMVSPSWLPVLQLRLLRGDRMRSECGLCHLQPETVQILRTQTVALLSLTNNCFGSPNRAKMSLSDVMVLELVVLFMM